MKITYPDHCGNSPKKALLIEIYKAIANADYDFILENLADNVKLNIIGVREAMGKEAVTSAMRELIAHGLTEIVVHDAITHGNTAAVHGSFIFGEICVDYCDVYKFNGFGKKAKIGEIKSYLINSSHHKIF